MARKKVANMDQSVEEEVPATPVVEDVVVETAVDAASEKKAKKAKKSKKAKELDKKTSPRSTRYAEAKAKVDVTTIYPISEAIALAKETSTTKFSGSVEIHLNTTQKGLRGFAVLPHATGKRKQILAFGNVKEQDGVIAGDEKSIDSIANGTLTPGKHFDVIIANPSYMPKLAKVAKILGPRGLMPNPKSGTVTENIDKAIADLLGGQVEYKTEANAPRIHTIIGKINLEDNQLIENYTALISAIGPSKISSASINATMGPGIKVKIA